MPNDSCLKDFSFSAFFYLAWQQNLQETDDPVKHDIPGATFVVTEGLYRSCLHKKVGMLSIFDLWDWLRLPLSLDWWIQFDGLDFFKKTLFKVVSKLWQLDKVAILKKNCKNWLNPRE